MRDEKSPEIKLNYLLMKNRQREGLEGLKKILTVLYLSAFSIGLSVQLFGNLGSGDDKQLPETIPVETLGPR